MFLGLEMSTAQRRFARGHAATLVLPVALLALAPLTAAATATRTVLDDTGRTVQVPARVERIVSLAPNLTEIVYALGLETRLVGVTNQCDFPPEAQSKPRVGDVINPNLERIIELKPDLVLATPAGNRRETADALERLGVPVYGVDPRSIAGVFASLRRLADLLGVAQAGEALAAQLEARLAALDAWLATPERPRVLFVIWLEPLQTVGNDTFLNDLLRRAGAESVTGGIQQSWPRLSIEEVLARNPDYLVLPRTHSLEARLSTLIQRPPWERLRAVEQGRIVWLDDAVLRPGPRLVDAVEHLARALHPEIFAREERAEK